MCGIFFYTQNDTISERILPQILDSLNTIVYRGPEHTKTVLGNNFVYSFHRLAINNTSDACNQPYTYEDGKFVYTVMCNGEIYNWRNLVESCNLNLGTCNNDCGVIFPLFKHLDYDFKALCSYLDGEFAVVILRKNKETNILDNIWFGTDVCSVRPLFYTFDEDTNTVVISSLLSGISNISNIKSKIHRVNGSEFYHLQYINKYVLKTSKYDNLYDLQEKSIIALNNTETRPEDYFDAIVDKFERAVYKRICDDNLSRPIGCLLSGGLDSSLVAAVASKHLRLNGKILNTFSIGMKGSTDLEYAKVVAQYIGSNHTEIIFTEEEGIEAIEEVIKVTETYDITTIRASVGQFLLSKWISKNTNIKVILNGDGADECQMGYLYFYNAPNAIEAQLDSIKLVKQIHYFDGLRVDRNVSHHGLEARVPYLDKDLVNFYLNIIPPKFKVPTFHCEKFLIRKAFERFNILPSEVLWRRKEAFSDGVSSLTKSWFQILTDYFNSLDIPSSLERDHNAPYTKESCYYRLKFEKYFGINDNVIPRFWLPSWSNEKDPSARKLISIYNQ